MVRLSLRPQNVTPPKMLGTIFFVLLLIQNSYHLECVCLAPTAYEPKFDFYITLIMFPYFYLGGSKVLARRQQHACKRATCFCFKVCGFASRRGCSLFPFLTPILMEEAKNIPLKHKLLCPAAAATAAAAVAVAAGQAAAIAAVAVTVAVAVAVAVVVIVAGARAGAMTIASNAQGRLRSPRPPGDAQGTPKDAQASPGAPEPRGTQGSTGTREILCPGTAWDSQGN